MLDLRSPLILAAAPVGLVLAALAWFAFDAASWVSAPLDRLEARLAATRPPAHPVRPRGNEAASALLAAPIFALTTGPGAVADPTVRLDGLAISPRGRSALLSVDGKPPEWIALGATVNGVTVMQIDANQVVVDTAIGFKEVPLWPSSPAAGAVPGVKP